MSPRAARPRRVAVVLTALDVEYVEVQRQLVSSEERLERVGSVLFRVADLKVAPEWRVASAVVGPGNSNTAVIATMAVTHFVPDTLIFVGVAGALKDDIQLGDLVCGTKLYGMHGGKAGPGEFLARPEVWRCHPLMESTARQVAYAERWLELLPSPGRSRPQVHFKPIVSGDIVLADRTSEEYARVRRTYNDAAAVEMEGAGLAQAAHHCQPTPALVVRGISDAAGPEKADLDRQGHQPVAAGNAAAFAAAVIASYPRLDRQGIDHEARSPRVLVDESDGVSIGGNVFEDSGRSDVYLRRSPGGVLTDNYFLGE